VIPKYLQSTRAFDFKIINGSVCLLHWLKTIGETMMDSIDLEYALDELNNLDKLDDKRDYIQQIMCTVFNMLESDLELENMKCEGETCDNSYDGKDLFILIKSTELE